MRYDSTNLTMKKYFGYVRVSTLKQGQHGVSLQEQRGAIEAYAARQGLELAEWYEERETAAKSGRPVFRQMLAALDAAKADGVLIHKIDRSARNLRDWADLGELIDRGIEVHFTTESLDLKSRGGRLSADIQAVVAADYVRNLREETRKGFYGRLKQGIYPLPAPIGYVDHGRGKPKTIDPITGPLVREAFSLYATGQETLHTLRAEMKARGLIGRFGKPLSLNGVSVMLRNPFYIGIIRIKRTNETFAGVHEPLISPATFETVGRVLDGKLSKRSIRHDFVFRRLIRCALCGTTLIGERQKGHIYYRCHTRSCATTGVREELIHEAVTGRYEGLTLDQRFLDAAHCAIGDIVSDWAATQAAQEESNRMAQAKIDDRLTRLTDAYIDGMIGRDVFEERRSHLLLDQARLNEAIGAAPADGRDVGKRVGDFLEYASSLHARYISANDPDRREMVEITTSNRSVEAKEVAVELRPAFRDLEMC